MNKYILMVVLLLGITSIHSDDIAIPIVEDNTGTEVSMDSEEPTIEAAVETAEAVEDVKLQNAYVSILWDLLAYVTVILGSIITAAIFMLIRKAGTKYGIDIPEIAEELLESLLIRCINSTESWAKSKAQKPSSEDKMAETIKLALQKVTTNEKLKKIIEDKGKEMVEKLLRSKETSDEVTPKDT